MAISDQAGIPRGDTVTISRPARPRILMVVPKYPFPVVGGLERQAHELSKALKNIYHLKVQILSTQFVGDQKPLEFVEGIQVTRVPWIESRLTRFFLTPLYVLSFLWKKRNEYDVIHTHQYSPFGLFVIFIARLFAKPVITKLPIAGNLGIQGLKYQSLGRLRHFILMQSTAIVAMSKVSINELGAAKYPAHRVLRVPNGIALREHNKSAGRIAKAKNKQLRIVFVGRIADSKRLDILLRAWEIVIKRCRITTAILEIWGDGPKRVELEALCDELNLSDSVNWRGHVADVREALTTADIFVLPSANEGNSNAILEAMAAGLPIVATPVGGTEMQVGQVGAPLLVPVGDVTQLAERIVWLINDAKIRDEFGKAMRLRIERYFDINKVAHTYLCAYLELMNTKNLDLSHCGILPEKYCA